MHRGATQARCSQIRGRRLDFRAVPRVRARRDRRGRRRRRDRPRQPAGRGAVRLRAGRDDRPRRSRCSSRGASARSTPTHRANYFEEPRTRPMGAGIELFAVRKDGTRVPGRDQPLQHRDRTARRSRRPPSATSASGRRASARRRCRISSTGRGGWRASASSPAGSPTTSTTSSA